MKRAGHLLSKMSFVSAQLDAYITNEVWLRNAKHANAMGKKLSQGLDQHKNIELAYPTDANEIFAKIPKDIIDQLNSEGYTINDDEWDGKAVRLVTAWNTNLSDIETFLNFIK
jgi:threonine aldolase